MLHLNRSLVHSRIAELRLDGLHGLAARAGVHRSTIWRWISNGLLLPRSPEQLLRLATALDADPIALFAAPPKELVTVITRFVRAATERRLHRLHPSLEVFELLIAPSVEWPPPAIAAAFGRTWYVHDLAVAPTEQGMGYRAVHLASPRCAGRRGTQVWHMAFQDTGGAIPTCWRSLGGVRCIAGALELLSVRGLVNYDEMRRGASDMDIELWVGPNRGRLRLASLHAFECEWARETGATPALRAPAPPARATLRFCEQGHPCLSRTGVGHCDLATRCSGFVPPTAARSARAARAPGS